MEIRLVNVSENYVPYFLNGALIKTAEFLIKI